MSVALLIEERGERRYIPVATQDNYVTRWLPGAHELGLEWVELAETGFPITAADRDDVVAEFRRLRAWMVARDQPHELVRLDTLIEALARIQFEPGTSIFLG